MSADAGVRCTRRGRPRRGARAIVTRHAAHLSRNARRARADGIRERFVTQRCYRGDRFSAASALAGLLTELTCTGYPIAEVEEEFVLVDDNPTLDADWFSPDSVPATPSVSPALSDTSGRSGLDTDRSR